MKKIILASLMALVSVNMMALTTSKIREYARFLSDRMAYELDLSASQYDDVYEINYDFIYSINTIMDDVVDGYIEAIDQYYEYLDYRNDDLRYVLTDSQYTEFLNCEYFYRPVYVMSSKWYLRIYNIYNNVSFFYYDRPTGYLTYSGAHARKHYANGYYVNRHTDKTHYKTQVKIRNSSNFSNSRRNDFGANLRGRNESTRVNNYKNANKENRTQDSRYKAEKKNVNSPAINNRDQQNKQNTSKQSAKTTQQKSSNSKDKNNKNETKQRARK